MNSFEYANPNTVEEAVALLASEWDETEVLAGGTDLVTSMKQWVAAPKRVVSLKNIKDLQGIEADEKQVRIGAMATLAELIENEHIQKHYPALITAARGVGSSQIINQGTVGGDLCQRPRCWYYRAGLGLLAQQNGKSLVKDGDNRYHAIFGNDGPAYFVNPSSLAPALIALGATITVQGPQGKSREIKAGEFFQTPKSESEREYGLQPNEILTHVTVPISNLKNATYEVRERQGLDWPLVAAAVAFNLDGETASDVRVVLGHVAPVPWDVPSAAKALDGKNVTEESAAECGETAATGAKPLSQNGYKAQLVRVAVKRAVLAATGKPMET
ncbi:MAG: FAD binding domain-containing protein [Candidatus Hydrogenedentes bacterium]|nr:FAD binding domain-containing protein [Candidatus Hydrogenedentota bacterium]